MEKVSDSRLTPQRLHSRDEMGGAGAPPFADGDFTAFHSAAKPPGKGQLRPICIISLASDFSPVISQCEQRSSRAKSLAKALGQRLGLANSSCESSPKSSHGAKIWRGVL